MDISKNDMAFSENIDTAFPENIIAGIHGLQKKYQTECLVTASDFGEKSGINLFEIMFDLFYRFSTKSEAIFSVSDNSIVLKQNHINRFLNEDKSASLAAIANKTINTSFYGIKSNLIMHIKREVYHNDNLEKYIKAIVANNSNEPFDFSVNNILYNIIKSTTSESQRVWIDDSSLCQDSKLFKYNSDIVLFENTLKSSDALEFEMKKFLDDYLRKKI